MYVYVCMCMSMGKEMLADFSILLFFFWQKIRTVELDGKTIKLQIVSQNFLLSCIERNSICDLHVTS